MPAPKMMHAEQAVAYIREKHGLRISRQTVTTWMTKGVKNETLSSKRLPCPRGKHGGGRWSTILFTCDLWIDEFLRRAYSELLQQQNSSIKDSAE